MNDAKPRWKANMLDNRIKIHKNLGRNDGSESNKVTLTGLHGKVPQLIPAEPAAVPALGEAWLEGSLCTVRPAGFLGGDFKNSRRLIYY